MRSQNDSEPIFAGFSSPNYTQVPDELFDLLMPRLGDAELRVLLYIVRRTFGFKKNSDDISLSQMVNGITTADGRVLDQGTGLSKATVARALGGLKDKGVIVAVRNRSAERGNEATTYRLLFRADTEHTPLVSAARQGGLSQQRDTPLSQQRDTQEIVIQETDESLSNFEKSHNQTKPGRAAARRPSSIAADGQNPAADASEARKRPSIPAPAITPRIGPENASEQPRPSTPVSPAFLAARAAIRSTLAARRPTEEPDPAPARRAPVARRPAAPQDASPATPPSRRGRPSAGTSAERDLVGAFLGDFNAELLHDDAAVPALITQAIHIFHAGAIPLEQWPDYLYHARTRVKERAGAITKVSTRDDGRKNRGPYYFAVLRDLVAAGAEREERAGS